MDMKTGHSSRFRFCPISITLVFLLLGGCALQPAAPPVGSCAPSICPACPVCPKIEVPKPPAKPLAKAAWEALPGWGGDDLAPVFSAFLGSCNALQRKAIWRDVCSAARNLENPDNALLQAWFEAQLQPWQLINPDGGNQGLVTCRCVACSQG